jgi:hypothetical protein
MTTNKNCLKPTRLEMIRRKILNDEILLWPYFLGSFLIAYVALQLIFYYGG